MNLVGRLLLGINIWTVVLADRLCSYNINGLGCKEEHLQPSWIPQEPIQDIDNLMKVMKDIIDNLPDFYSDTHNLAQAIANMTQSIHQNLCVHLSDTEQRNDKHTKKLTLLTEKMLELEHQLLFDFSDYDLAHATSYGQIMKSISHSYTQNCVKASDGDNESTTTVTNITNVIPYHVLIVDGVIMHIMAPSHIQCPLEDVGVIRRHYHKDIAIIVQETTKNSVKHALEVPNHIGIKLGDRVIVYIAFPADNSDGKFWRGTIISHNTDCTATMMPTFTTDANYEIPDSVAGAPVFNDCGYIGTAHKDPNHPNGMKLIHLCFIQHPNNCFPRLLLSNPNDLIVHHLPEYGTHRESMYRSDRMCKFYQIYNAFARCTNPIELY